MTAVAVTDRYWARQYGRPETWSESDLDEVREGMTELERQLALFPRVVIDKLTFDCLYAFVGGAQGWDYTPVWKCDHVSAYILHREDAGMLHKAVLNAAARLVATQLTA